jgi:RNA polymerase-binding transcription factor DksA
MTLLTTKQAIRIGAALTARRQVLRDEIRAVLATSGNEQYQDLAGAVRDAGDESVADQLHDIALQEVHRDVQELREVEAALGRLAQGTLGTCTGCGGPVGDKRLEVQPAATRCITCQDKYDRTHAHAGTPSL